MSVPKFIFLQQPPTVAPATDWEMWSAIATGGATAVALALPFVMRALDSRATSKRTRIRTAAAGPGIAADVMQVNWHLTGLVQQIAPIIAHPSIAGKCLALQEKFDDGSLLCHIFPGRTLPSGDRENLDDSVRTKVAELYAQVLALNAMWRRLLKGPFGRFANAAESVDAMLPEMMLQIVAVYRSCKHVMDAMKSYLPPELNMLGDSIASQDPIFDGFAARAIQAKREYQERQAAAQAG